jgi:Arc/MetJ family transcription regulator
MGRTGSSARDGGGGGAKGVQLSKEVHIMRTNIVIDDRLMSDTLRATGLKTKREAVERGLETLLRLSKQAQVRKLRGKLAWQGDLNAMRSAG